MENKKTGRKYDFEKNFAWLYTNRICTSTQIGWGMGKFSKKKDEQEEKMIEEAKVTNLGGKKLENLGKKNEKIIFSLQ